MFWTSYDRPIDPELNDVVAEIEEQNSSLTVLVARQFAYSLRQTKVEYEQSQPRPLNVLEDFILKAGSEFDPLPNETELAEVLGLDLVFVANTTATLRHLKILSPEAKPVIELTSMGREFYQHHSLPDVPETKIGYAISQPFSDTCELRSSAIKPELIKHLPDLNSVVKFENCLAAIGNLSLLEFRKLVNDLDSSGENKIVTSFTLNSPSETIQRSLSLLVIFDFLENKLKIQARLGTAVSQAASTWLNNLLAADSIYLNTLCQLTDEEIDDLCREIISYRQAQIDKRIKQVRKQASARQQQHQSNAETKIVTGTAEQLRGGAISQELDKILDFANRQILIYSPWISARVVNDVFINRLQRLADKGVWIIIGYGISQNQEDETRPIPEQVSRKLKAILNSAGMPAVQFFWLGGSHAKELIVDRQVHLLGSNNFLSFRASSGLWDESVYKVTIPQQVEEAYNFYAQRFYTKAKELWHQSLEDRQLELATQALYLWKALEMEAIASNHLTHSNWPELNSIWHKIRANS